MPTYYCRRGKHNVMLFTQDSGFLRVSGWQKIGVLVSILWMVGLPICMMIDSNRRASEFYDMCRKVESNLGSDLSTAAVKYFRTSTPMATPTRGAHQPKSGAPADLFHERCARLLFHCRLVEEGVEINALRRVGRTVADAEAFDHLSGAGTIEAINEICVNGPLDQIDRQISVAKPRATPDLIRFTPANRSEGVDPLALDLHHWLRLRCRSCGAVELCLPAFELSGMGARFNSKLPKAGGQRGKQLTDARHKIIGPAGHHCGQLSRAE
jgi:hypothetical protein